MPASSRAPSRLADPTRELPGAAATSLTASELALIAGFWVVLGAIMAGSRLLDPRGLGPDSPLARTVALISFAQAMLWALLTPLVFAAVSRLNPERGDRLAGALALVAVTLAAALLVHLLGNLLRSELLPAGPGGGRGGPMRDAMREAMREGGGMRGRGGRMRPWRVERFGYLNDLVTAGGVLAAGIARDVSLRYRARKEQATRLQAQLAEARLDALRRQLDPHFLFNTLNAVSALVERDPRGVRRMISRLSELLRHSMETGDEPEIPLERELALLQRYVDIMLVRFQGRLEVEMRVDDAARGAMVPNLVLQPLVENAIRHGVSQVEGVGHIVVEARRAGPELVLRVRDDGTGVSAAPGEGVGLRNTRERLAQLHGAAGRFTLSPAEGGGTVAELVIPFRTALHGAATGGATA